MKIKNKAKLNIFAMLGWLVWKLLSLFGSRHRQDEARTASRAQAPGERRTDPTGHPNADRSLHTTLTGRAAPNRSARSASPCALRLADRH